MSQKVTFKILVSLAIGLLPAKICLADSTGETLLDGSINRTGHYYSLDFRSGSVRGEGSQIVGAQWGSVYNDLFSVGLGLNGLMSKVQAPESYGTGSMSFYYYGLQCEYEALSWSVLNLNAGAFAGLGHPGYRTPDTIAGKRGKYVDATNKVLEGSVIATMNLSPRAKVGVGVIYRYATSPGLEGLSGANLSGVDVLLTLRSGTF